MFLSESTTLKFSPIFGIGIIINLTFALGLIIFIYNLGMILINPEKLKQFIHCEENNDVSSQYISKKMLWAGFGLFTILLGVCLSLLSIALLR
jgi:hypothetical protein